MLWSDACLVGVPEQRERQSSFLKESKNSKCANEESHPSDAKISVDITAGYHRIEPEQVQIKDLKSSRRHESLNRHEHLSEFPATCP